MSDACNGIGCREKGPHLNFQTLAQERLADLDEEQREEGLRREIDLSDLAPLSDGSDAPFTTDGTPDESPTYAWYRDMEVEVVDPTPYALTPSQIRTLEGLGELVQRVKNPTFEDEADAIFAECRDLLVQRQVRYGPSNIEQQGMWGVLSRIANDKLERIKRAFNGQIVNGVAVLDELADEDADESLEDAIKDLVNYGVILLLLKRGVWGRPLAGEQE